ncbi:hypothetical protein HZB01_05520 [Candidatus Woesearchaeota archaeon]|nr:hypothetical protein [Candidatus Woesearchaeota archaeon]
MRGKQLGALIVVFLIVSMPFVSAAQTRILALDVAGQDGILGYKKVQDTMTLAAILSNVTDPVNLQYSGEPFTSCDTVQDPASSFFGKARCTLTFDQSSRGFRETYLVRLFNISNETSVETSRKTAEAYVDSQAPFAVALSAQMDTENNTPLIVLSYNVKDSACIAPSCTDKCSGIGMVSFFFNETLLKESTINSSSCISSGEESIAATPLGDGSKEICMVVKDRMQQNSSTSLRCAQITIDTTPPKADSASLQIVDASASPVRYVGRRGGQASLIVNITEEHRLESAAVNISGTLTSLSCRSAVPIYLCTASITLPNQTLSTLTVISVDAAGNKGLEEMPLTITLDDISPTISETTTTRGNVLGKENNTITVQLGEDGSGLFKKEVFMDMSRATDSAQDTVVRATNCTLGWSCTWESIEANAAEGANITVSIHGEDDVGNTFIANATLIVDTIPPSEINVTIHSQGQTDFNRSLLGSAFFSGETLIAEAYVLEGASDSMQASLNSSSVNGSIIAGACNFLGNKTFSCMWDAIPILSAYQQRAPLIFTFTDAAGNSRSVIQEITVLESRGEEMGGNLTVLVDENNVFPEGGISRFTASLLPNPPGYRIAVPFAIGYTGTRTAGLDILSESVGKCKINVTGPLNGSIEFGTLFPNGTQLALEKTSLGEMNRLELTMATLDGATAAKIDSLAFHCPLTAYVRTPTAVYLEPKQAMIDFTLPLRDSALNQDPSKQLLDKIKKAQKGSLVGMTWIGTIEKWLSRLTAICDYFQKFISLWQVFGMLEASGAAVQKISPAAGKVLFKVGCFGYEGMGSVIGPLWYGSKGIAGKKFGISNCKEGGMVDHKITNEPLTFKEAVQSQSKFSLRWACGWTTCKYAFDWWRQYENLPFNNIDWSALSGEPTTQVIDGNIQSRRQGGANAAFRNLTGRDLLTLKASFNWRNSIVVSVGTACLPGVFYNLQKYRQIDCRYINCLRNLGSSGADISVCESARAQATCLAVTGEVIEVVGPLNILRSVSQQIRDLAYNAIPAGLHTLFAGYCAGEKNLGTVLGCDLVSIFYTALDVFNNFSSYKQYANPTYWQLNLKVGDDECSKALCKEWDYKANKCKKK